MEHESDHLPSVTGVLGTINEGLLQGLEDVEITRRVEIIQTTALLRFARTLWIVV